MRNKKLLVLPVALALFAAYFVFDIGQYLSLEFLQSKHQLLLEYATENPITSFAFYFLLFVVAAVLSVPAISILTIGAGAIFGFIAGFILASFASAVGATLAFLLSRYFFKGVLQKKFSAQLKTINTGVEKEGTFYLFSMRLVPIVPFFVINLLMGLTSIKTSLFYIVSQAGMMPTTAIFTYSGNQLAQFESLKDIFSPSLLFAFFLLGLFTITAKILIEFYKRGK